MIAQSANESNSCFYSALATPTATVPVPATASASAIVGVTSAADNGGVMRRARLRRSQFRCFWLQLFSWTMQFYVEGTGGCRHQPTGVRTSK